MARVFDSLVQQKARAKAVEAPQEVPALEPVHPGAPQPTQQQLAQRQAELAQELAEVGPKKGGPEPTISPDEFESALNAARTMMRKGDFEGAEYLFAQCNGLLDYHEGEGLHTAYLTVDWAPCLNQLKRFEEATAICERAMRILDQPEFQQYEELSQVKIPVYHACAVACVGLHKFAEGRELIDACLELIGKADPYKAFILLVKCDLLEKEAESIEKDSGKAAAFVEVLDLALQSAQQARAVLDEHAGEFAQHPIFFKPDTSMVSIFLTWGRMDEAEDMQEQLIKKMALSGQVPPARIAFQTDEFADICLDSGKMAKAERLYLDALKIWEGVPGLAGQANVNKARCELAHKIYFCQPETIDKANALFEETRQFTEKYMLAPPKSENMEIRVQEAHFEYIGMHPSGGVEAQYVFQIRLKRRIQDKKPRLPAGSKLTFFLAEWDNKDVVLAGLYKGEVMSSFSIVLDADVLDNEDRARRVVNFSVTLLRPLARSYKCFVQVTDGASEKVLSSLQQHVVSYVDCPSTTTLDAAKEIFSKHLTATEEIMG